MRKINKLPIIQEPEGNDDDFNGTMSTLKKIKLIFRIIYLVLGFLYYIKNLSRGHNRTRLS